MGAWAETAFGNDTAADWAGDAGEAGTLAFVEQTLNAVLDHAEYLDTGETDPAIGAASVVAWLNGHPTDELAGGNAYADQALTALAPHKGSAEAKALIAPALRAITRLMDPKDNEAWELWFEDDPVTDTHPWLVALKDVEAKLKAAAAG